MGALREIIQTDDRRQSGHAGLAMRGERGVGEIRHDHEHAAEHQRAGAAPARHRQAARQDAGEGPQRAVDLGHGGHLLEREAEIEIERVRHYAHGEIRQAIGADEGEQQQPESGAVAREEIQHRADHGPDHPRTCISQPAGPMRVPLEPVHHPLLGQHRDLRHAAGRLGHQQRGQDPDPHQHRHERIRALPAEIGRGPQRPGRADDQRQPLLGVRLEGP